MERFITINTITTTTTTTTTTTITTTGVERKTNVSALNHRCRYLSVVSVQVCNVGVYRCIGEGRTNLQVVRCVLSNEMQMCSLNISELMP